MLSTFFFALHLGGLAVTIGANVAQVVQRIARAVRQLGLWEDEDSLPWAIE
jgi:hypothetical protein